MGNSSNYMALSLIKVSISTWFSMHDWLSSITFNRPQCITVIYLVYIWKQVTYSKESAMGNENCSFWNKRPRQSFYGSKFMQRESSQVYGDHFWEKWWRLPQKFHFMSCLNQDGEHWWNDTQMWKLYQTYLGDWSTIAAIIISKYTHYQDNLFCSFFCHLLFGCIVRRSHFVPIQ